MTVIDTRVLPCLHSFHLTQLLHCSNSKSCFATCTKWNSWFLVLISSHLRNTLPHPQKTRETVVTVLTMHVADPSLTPKAPYIIFHMPQACQDWSLCTEPGISPENHRIWQKIKKKVINNNKEYPFTQVGHILDPFLFLTSHSTSSLYSVSQCISNLTPLSHPHPSPLHLTPASLQYPPAGVSLSQKQCGLDIWIMDQSLAFP